jgi:formylmethanofuran dehydrogenase subunit E
MYRSDDPERDFLRYDAEQAREEARLPHCDYCEEAIYDTYYSINGEIICEECLENLFRHSVHDYLDE